MWSAKSEVADLYLSGQMLAWRVAGGQVQSSPLGEDWIESLHAALAAWPKRRWRLWLGGRRCGLHLCEPIAGIGNIEEAEAALGASLGLDGRPASVRLATWPAAPHRWVALVTEPGLVDGLASAVQATGGKVQSVRPWWTTLTEGGLAAAAMCDDEAITYWRQEESGAFAAAATLWSAPDQQPATLQRLSIGGAISVRRLSLQAPSDSAPGFVVSRMDGN